MKQFSSRLGIQDGGKHHAMASRTAGFSSSSQMNGSNSNPSDDILKQLDKDVRLLEKRVNKYMNSFATESQQLRDKISKVLNVKRDKKKSDEIKVVERERSEKSENKMAAMKDDKANRKEVLIEDVYGFSSSKRNYRIGFDFSGHESKDLEVHLEGYNVIVNCYSPPADATESKEPLEPIRTKQELLPKEAKLDTIRALFDKNNNFLIVEVSLPKNVDPEEVKKQMDAQVKEVVKPADR
ncbi:hypothetical protein HDE_10564 [Halotydeus destructor]|nr:hypothetical protein HDE_10564 [Halotydeus destructor]